MRNTCDSSKAVWISAVSAFAESSECPNGFSTTMRELAVLAPMRGEAFDDRRERLRRHGEVEEPRAVGS